MEHLILLEPVEGGFAVQAADLGVVTFGETIEAAKRAVEIAIGFTTAFLASLVVVGPFLALVRRSGFAPFAWYRIIVGIAALLWLGMR